MTLLVGPDAGEVTLPVRMWLEAIDLPCKRLRDHVDFWCRTSVFHAQMTYIFKLSDEK